VAQLRHEGPRRPSRAAPAPSPPGPRGAVKRPSPSASTQTGFVTPKTWGFQAGVFGW
jgi:hypothetical protein